MFRAAYLGILICIFTIAIAIPAMAQPSCEQDIQNSYNDLLATVFTDTDAPVTLLAATDPGEPWFVQNTESWISKFARNNSYRLIIQKVEGGISAELMDDLKAKAGGAAFIILDFARPLVTINESNIMSIPKEVLGRLEQTAAEWKKENRYIRFFVRGFLQRRVLNNYSYFSLTPRFSQYWDATPAPMSSPQFINISRDVIVVLYPNHL